MNLLKNWIFTFENVIFKWGKAYRQGSALKT